MITMCEGDDNKKAITSMEKSKDIIKSLSFSMPEKEQKRLLGTGTAQVTSGGNRDDDGSKTNETTSITTPKEIITGKYSHHVFQCHSN